MKMSELLNLAYSYGQSFRVVDTPRSDFECVRFGSYAEVYCSLKTGDIKEVHSIVHKGERIGSSVEQLVDVMHQRYLDNTQDVPNIDLSVQKVSENELQQIVVYDYTDKKDDEYPDKLDVKALCVGGTEGVLALWIDDDKVYIAKGDDGTWSLLHSLSSEWLSQMIETMDNLKHLFN